MSLQIHIIIRQFDYEGDRVTMFAEIVIDEIVAVKPIPHLEWVYEVAIHDLFQMLEAAMPIDEMQQLLLDMTVGQSGQVYNVRIPFVRLAPVSITDIPHFNAYQEKQ